MQQDKEITNLDKTVAFIERWAVIFLVLAPYLFLSYIIIYILAHPPAPSTEYCGTGLFAAIIGHLFLAIVAGLILAFRLTFGKAFDRKTKLIIALLIIIPLIISFSFF